VKRRAARRVAAGATNASSLRQRLDALAPPERDRAMLDVVRGEIASVLGLRAPSSIDPLRPLQELGLDSLMAVELRNRFAAAAGVRLPATLVFDHPTPKALAAQLLAKMTHAAGDPAARSAADIDKVESALLALSRDVASRDALTVRLQALLAQWNRDRTDQAGADLAGRLDAASDDELLQMIDDVTLDTIR
jgi:acyl carrier protein